MATKAKKKKPAKRKKSRAKKAPRMKTTFKTINALIKDDSGCPLPLDIIPNNMGINLCSVDGISWQKQGDGQLTNLTIHFIPGED